MNKVLLLNKSFEPISIITWRRAIKMLCLGKAETIEEYNEKITSQKTSISFPAVLRLTHDFKRNKRSISFSKNNIFIRDKSTCQYCQQKFPISGLTLDHVLPRSRGGHTTWENIVACCHECNYKKGSRTPSEARMELRRSPTQPEWISFFNMVLRNQTIPTEWKYFCYF